MSTAFTGYNFQVDAPATQAAEVTPDDGTNLTSASRAVYVGGAGNLRVTMIGGQTVTLSNVPAGTLLPICVQRVWNTGTTATLIDVLW